MTNRAIRPVRVAIAGVGNCASSLVQGINYYRKHPNEELDGIMLPIIGGVKPGDIEIVCAFDVDSRKVGRPLAEAIFAKPNNAWVFEPEIDSGDFVVQMGPVEDGVPPHMSDFPEDRAFRASNAPAVEIAAALKQAGAEVFICYLPVGSERAVRQYAEACLTAGVAMVNCMPVFLASDREWAEKFVKAGVPIIGDDIKSQIGATIIHRSLAHLFQKRGCHLKHTYQLNTGGNTDFLNMKAQDRLASKRKSKTQSVQSQLPVPLDDEDIHIGPSDYVAWQKDNKVAFIRMEGAGFAGAPIEIELRLSVQDSPNSAGVVIDAVRCAKLALERGLSGPLIGPSAGYMKSPPEQMDEASAFEAIDQFVRE